MKIKIIILLIFTFPAFFFAKDSENRREIFTIKKQFLPEIENLSSSDYIFKQFVSTVEENDKNLANGQEIIPEFYKYKVKKTDTLFTISASTGLPYDTISILNGISFISDSITGKTLILPVMKGLFVKEKPSSSTEFMIYSDNDNLLENCKNLCYNFNGIVFVFIPGKRFSSTARAYFLDSSMRLPLDEIRITSDYGMRLSPVSGNWKFHKGIDFACKEGTPVRACKNGTVEFLKKNDSIFGNYLILRHSNGMTSVYAHLSKINVSKGDSVTSGKIIGLSGQTGAVTGPHLHFEIKKNGRAANPLDELGIQEK